MSLKVNNCHCSNVKKNHFRDSSSPTQVLFHILLRKELSYPILSANRYCSIITAV